MRKFSRKRDESTRPQHSPPGPGDEGDNHVVDLLGITIAAINTTKDLVPIDLAKGILGTMANILTIAQSVIKNKSDFLAIADRCDTIRRALERATEGTTRYDPQGPLGNALSQLSISVNRILSEVATKKEHSFWKRLFSVTIDRDRIAAWGNDLDRIILLFNFEAIVGVAIRTEQHTPAVEISNNPSNVLRIRKTVPPSRPSMFYGRDDLVAELTNLVVNDQHIALIGTGGMGKSSLAKAVLNEPLVIGKFAERRFFVTYDGLDPSTITFDAFITRFASNLGIGTAGADPTRQISTFLSSAPALIILDNAETFEDASGSSTLHKISPAIANIADTPGVVLILTSRSRRNALNVPWITKDIPPLDISSALEAFFRIYSHASRSDTEEEITTLLEELECHPLSINLLATAAQQNSWSLPTLLKRWNDQPGAVLDQGEGKLESLSATMQLSFNSPSIQKLGEDGRRALAVIAYLPQGLNDDLSKDLLPSLHDITTICDVLCRQSLVYRQGTFVKMLAPIRHHVQKSSPTALISNCLGDIRTFYYRTVRQSSKERDNDADNVVSDHLNIEHVIAFDLGQIPKGIEETCDICGRFFLCLSWHLPRPTALAPAIFNIIENPSTWKLKAECLRRLAHLYFSHSQHAEATNAFRTAEALYFAASDHENVASCVAFRADVYTLKGHYIQAQEVLEDVQRSDSWMHLSEATKTQVCVSLAIVKTFAFTTSVDELYLGFMEDPMWGLLSKVWHWRVKLCHGEDIMRVKIHLEELLQESTDSGDPICCTEALRGLTEVAFCQDRLSEAMDILQKVAEMYGREDPEQAIWSISRKAVAASLMGDYDLARELIHKTSESLEFFMLPSAYAFLHRYYGSAQVELTAGEYDMAESYFNATIEGCDIQGNLYYKAVSVRGLGEVALARGNFALAAQRFSEARSLCTEMGVPPRNLYSCQPFDTLPERFEGWVSFLESRPPFATSI